MVDISNIEKVNKKRNIYIDILRILACFFVILRHVVDLTLINDGVSRNWKVGIMFNILTYTSIPLFIMITGYLMLDKQEDYKEFFRKRFSKIAIPFIFWSFIYQQFGNKYCSMGLDSNFFRLILKGNIFYHLWYVYFIIGVYIAIPIIRKFLSSSKTKDVGYIVSIWLGLSVIMPIITKFTGYDINIDFIFTGYWGYLFLGYLLRKVPLSKKYFNFSVLIFLFTYLLIFIMTIKFTAVNNIVFLNHLDLFSITMVCMTICLFYIFRYLDSYKYKFNKIIEITIVSISNLTFSIYLVHALVIDIFYRGILGVTVFPTFIDPIFGAPLLSLLVFIISLTIVFILSKIPVLKKLV